MQGRVRKGGGEVPGAGEPEARQGEIRQKGGLCAARGMEEAD